MVVIEKIANSAIRKDWVYNNLHTNATIKIPTWDLNVLGDESGMEGNIIINAITGEFCFHDGITWICITEPTIGVIGSTGPVGQIGSTGPAGANGAIGLTGPVGIAGVAGGIGPIGSNGPLGPTGPTGPQGAAGVDATGATGSNPWTVDSVNYVQNTMYASEPVAPGINNLLFGSDKLNTSTDLPRLFFITNDADSLGAFRAGIATSTQWDLVNCSINSTAFGINNQASGYNTFVGSGSGNTTSGFNSAIIGGSLHRITNVNSIIGAGLNNTIYGLNSIITGGYKNAVNVYGINNCIGAGDINYILSNNSFIGTGNNNTILTSYNANSFIAIGVNNIIDDTGSNSGIIVGSNNNIKTSNSCIASGLSQSLTDQDNTVLCDRLRIHKGIQLTPKVITADYQVQNDDYFLLVDAVSDITITFPLSPVVGQMFYVYMASDFNVTLNASAFLTTRLSTYSPSPIVSLTIPYTLPNGGGEKRSLFCRYLIIPFFVLQPTWLVS